MFTSAANFTKHSVLLSLFVQVASLTYVTRLDSECYYKDKEKKKDREKSDKKERNLDDELQFDLPIEKT